MAAECRKRAHLAADAEIVLYEEVQVGLVEKITNYSATLDKGLDEIMDGDVIVFHEAFEPSRKLKSINEFYTYIQFKFVYNCYYLS